MQSKEKKNIVSLVSYKHSMLTKAIAMLSCRAGLNLPYKKIVACLLILTFTATNLCYGYDRSDFQHLRAINARECAQGKRVTENQLGPPAHLRIEEIEQGQLWGRVAAALAGTLYVGFVHYLVNMISIFTYLAASLLAISLYEASRLFLDYPIGRRLAEKHVAAHEFKKGSSDLEYKKAGPIKSFKDFRLGLLGIFVTLAGVNSLPAFFVYTGFPLMIIMPLAVFTVFIFSIFSYSTACALRYALADEFALFKKRLPQDIEGIERPAGGIKMLLEKRRIVRIIKYFRKIYGRDDPFKIRTRDELLRLLIELKSMQSIRRSLKNKLRHYNPEGDEFKQRRYRLYKRYEDLYRRKEGKGETISLYTLLFIRSIAEGEKLPSSFTGLYSISPQAFFALLDIYLLDDVSQQLISKRLQAEVSLFTRSSERDMLHGASLFNPIRKRYHVRDEMRRTDMLLASNDAIANELERWVMTKERIRIERFMAEAGYEGMEKREALLLFLALFREEALLGRKRYHNDYKVRYLRIDGLIMNSKGKRLEETLDFYYTLLLYGNGASDIFEALSFACDNLDEDTYDRALEEAYRLARLGINPVHFLRSFVTYVGKHFQGEELEGPIALYEDLALTFYKYREMNPEFPEKKIQISAPKRDVNGNVVYDKKSGRYESVWLVDLVDKEDFIYSLELTKEIAGVGDMMAQGRHLLESLTAMAARVDRSEYRNTVNFLYNLVFLEGRPFFRGHMRSFISDVIPQIVSRLNPERFMENVSRIVHLLEKMEEKGMQRYHAYEFFRKGALYQNQGYFDIIMGLAEELVEDGRDPGPFLNIGLADCLPHIEGKEDRQWLAHLLYSISRKSDPEKLYPHRYNTTAPLDYLIFLDGLPAIMWREDEHGKREGLILGKGLLRMLERIIRWMDEGATKNVIMDRMQSKIPLAYGCYPIDDPRFDFIIERKGEEDSAVLRDIVLNLSIDQGVRIEAARNIWRSQEILEGLVGDVSLSVEIRQAAFGNLVAIADTETLKRVIRNSDLPLNAYLRGEIRGNINNTRYIEALKALIADASTNLSIRRRAAEALGDMLNTTVFSFPEIDLNNYYERPDEHPIISWEEFLDALGLDRKIKPVIEDRTLILDISDEEEIRVKLGMEGSYLVAHAREAQWLLWIKENRERLGLKSTYPEPVKVRGEYVFRLKDLPFEMPDGIKLDDGGYATALKYKREFFLNDPSNVSPEELKEGIRKASYDMGRLASLGIFHASLIPLFHNRLQRRDDSGFYEWWQGGRLDRWLTSCEKPNVGRDGLRDTEHLLQYGNFGTFKRAVEKEFFSLALVIGSYFRNRDRGRVGLTKEGEDRRAEYGAMQIYTSEPLNTLVTTDARDLFDKSLLKDALYIALSSYYEGLFGRPWAHLPFDLDNLSDGMIEEMGIDKYMSEILRPRTQREMSQEEFHDCLRKGGCSEAEIRRLTKGLGDIYMITGPHLGRFNGDFSIPELLDVVIILGALLSCEMGFSKLEYAGDLYPVPDAKRRLILSNDGRSIYITARFDRDMRRPKAEIWYTENGLNWQPAPMEVVNDWGDAFRFKGRVPDGAKKLNFRFFVNNLLTPIWAGIEDLTVASTPCTADQVRRKPYPETPECGPLPDLPLAPVDSERLREKGTDLL